MPGLALLAPLVTELVEQDLAKLLGAADSEFLSGESVDLALQPRDLAGELLGQLRQPHAVHLDPLALHPRDHRDQRAIDPFVDAAAPLNRKARLEHRMEPPGDVRILGGVLRRPVERHLAEQDRLLAGAAQVLEGDGIVIEVALAQLVHAVAASDTLLAAPGIEVEADYHRVVDGAHVDPGPRQHVAIILAVVEDLEDRFVLQQRLQRSERLCHRHLLGLLGEHVSAAPPDVVMTERDVAGIVRPEGEAHPDQFGAHRIEARLSVSTATICAARARAIHSSSRASVCTVS